MIGIEYKVMLKVPSLDNNQERCDETLFSAVSPEELHAVQGGAHYNCRDADGHVPEYYGHYGTSEGLYGNTAVLSRHPCQRAIYYNLDMMANAGPHDWAVVKAHERAHARGWDHWQGSPSTNPAYYATGNLTGH